MFLLTQEGPLQICQGDFSTKDGRVNVNTYFWWMEEAEKENTLQVLNFQGLRRNASTKMKGDLNDLW